MPKTLGLLVPCVVLSDGTLFNQLLPVRRDLRRTETPATHQNCEYTYVHVSHSLRSLADLFETPGKLPDESYPHFAFSLKLSI